MMADLGYQFSLKVITDASAAKANASRQGLGKTRHIAVHYLWVQQRVKHGDFAVEKSWGGENPADLYVGVYYSQPLSFRTQHTIIYISIPVNAES